MGSGSYQQVNILCPFYHHDDGKHKILCDGIVEGSNLGWYFRRKRDLDIQMSTFCKCKFSNCEIYRALTEVFDEDGDEFRWGAVTADNGTEE